MMQKNEADLLRPWVAYHAYLFGAENLYIFDNGSDDPDVIQQLEYVEGQGVTVDRSHPKEYERKNPGIGRAGEIRFPLSDGLRRISRPSEG